MNLFKKLLKLIQFFLVFIYILFEELVWERIAEPIYEYIKSLKIAQKLAIFIERSNGYLILFIYIILLVLVELAGIMAAIFLVRGNFTLAILAYLFKIPLASFLVWFFMISKEKLLQFGWFRYLYYKVVALINIIKESEVYKSIISYAKKIKLKFKEALDRFRKDGKFFESLKRIYKIIKKEIKE